MMTILLNSAEGQANNTVLSAANSGGGSGDAFTATETTMKFSTTQKAHGLLAYWRDDSGVATAVTRWAINANAVAVSAYFRIGATVSVNELTFIQIGTTASNSAIYLQGISDGKLRCGSMGVVRWTSAGVIPATTWVRLELYATAGTSSITGSVRAAIYLGDSTTAEYDSTLMTGINTADALAAFNNIRIGKLGSTSYTDTLYFDSLQAHTGADATGLIGPWALPPLDTPVVTITGQVDPTTIAGADGTITITWPAVSGADHYEVGKATVLGETDTFTEVSASGTSPFTFTGLTAGPYTVAVRAMPAA